MEFVVFTGVLLFIFLFMIVQELMQAKKRKNIPELSLGKLRKRTAEGIFAGEICKAWQLSGTT